LGEVLHITEQEAGDGVVGHVGIEGKEAGLLEEVVDIDGGLLSVETKAQVVLSELKVKIVAQGVVGAGEVSQGIAADSEEVGDSDLVDLLEGGLPDIDPEIVHVD